MATASVKVSSLARSHTEGAIRVLAAIMHSEDAPDAARIAAANSILDRGWGKAAQPITGDPENPAGPVLRIELVGVTPVPAPPY